MRIYEQLKDKIEGKSDTYKFIIIDGDGGFDLSRLEQILSLNGVEEPSEVQPFIQYYQPVEFDEQHKLITEELPKLLKDKGIQPLFISADPLIAIYRGIVLRTVGQYKMVTMGSYTGKLDLQLMRLRTIAVRSMCPAIVTSWEGSPVGRELGGKPPEVPMIGGRAFGYIPKVIIELIPHAGSVMREAKLFKHRSKTEGLSCFFKLCDSGVCDVEESDLIPPEQNQKD